MLDRWHLFGANIPKILQAFAATYGQTNNLAEGSFEY